MDGYLDIRSFRYFPSYHLRSRVTLHSVIIPLGFPAKQGLVRNRKGTGTWWLEIIMCRKRRYLHLHAYLYYPSSFHYCSRNPHISIFLIILSHVPYVPVGLHLFNNLHLLPRASVYKYLLDHLTYAPIPLPTPPNPSSTSYTLLGTLPPLQLLPSSVHRAHSVFIFHCHSKCPYHTFATYTLPWNNCLRNTASAWGLLKRFTKRVVFVITITVSASTSLLLPPFHYT